MRLPDSPPAADTPPAAKTVSSAEAPRNAEPAAPETATRQGIAAPAAGARGARIFDLLVEDEDDLVGYVAYGLYKKEKLAFMANRPGCADQDISVYCDTVRMRTAYYREEAEGVLQAMQQSLYAENLESEQRKYEKQLAEQVEKVHSHGYWYHVLQHALASAGAIIILYVLLLALIAWRSGPMKLWHQFGEAQTGPTSGAQAGSPPADQGTPANSRQKP